MKSAAIWLSVWACVFAPAAALAAETLAVPGAAAPQIERTALEAAAPAQRAPAQATDSAPGCGQIDADLATKLSIARRTLNEGKGHAAIAYLDSLRSNRPEAQLIRADALRRVEMLDEAKPIYLVLQDTCLRPYALHGLGLIESAQGRLGGALAYLRQATELLPLNAVMRNDLGYLYLEQRDYPRAAYAFKTAIELEPADKRPLYNLILTYIRQGEHERARLIAHRADIPGGDLDALFALAKSPVSETPANKGP